MKNSYCEDCGEEYSDCICTLISYIDYQESSFKFEWAFESLTEGYTKFKAVPPLYEKMY